MNALRSIMPKQIEEAQVISQSLLETATKQLAHLEMRQQELKNLIQFLEANPSFEEFYKLLQTSMRY